MSSEPPYPSEQGALPAVWPTAWPSMRGHVLLGSTLPVVAALVVVVVLVLTQTIASAWWFVLLPLLLLGWPLSLPSRVRTVVQGAHRARTLDVVYGAVGLIAEVRHRRLGVRPNAEVVPGRPVRYYLNSGKRSLRAR